jgi:hypothetical protein
MNTQKKKTKETKIYNPRKERGRGRNIFLIQTHEYDQKIKERKYDIMGTTKNVYTVTINKTPSCTCPDYKQRGKRCKHIYFVLTQIMKVCEEREDIKSYTDNELADMFSKIPMITENLRVNAQCLDNYLCKKNKNGEVDRKNITDEDVCPICLGDMIDQDDELTYCKYSCGSSVHSDCFKMFNSQRNDVKCLFCQKKWIEETYVNLC